MSVVCEASGMLGQQYVKSMVWEVSEWCIRSVVRGLSNIWGSVVCGGKWDAGSVVCCGQCYMGAVV